MSAFEDPTIADILAVLVRLHLPRGTALLEIPPEQRQPLRPRRFCFEVQGIPAPERNG